MGFPSDPTFIGTFPSSDVRSALRNTMQIGPSATFIWSTSSSYETESPAGNPYDWTSDPVKEEVHAEVTIPVAMEFTGGQQDDQYNPVGDFNPRAITIYVLDVDYPLIEGATQVSVSGQIYDIKFHAPRIELVDIQMEVLHCQAKDLG